MHNTLKHFGTLALIVGIAAGVLVGAFNQSIVETLIIGVPALVIGLFFMGFGALLESVHKIQVHLTGEDEIIQKDENMDLDDLDM
ncbi:hypothetical protein NYE69_26990 [Paenibacillus sp. FSL R5-0527]|uniref:hypothetical protein n=1 Tax=Paenibacillus sp. FSL R5-0527 TaxID=2975321 RepID=UPI00097B1D8A|nr:hypothetical protein BK140_22495 [Paenibacillus macerans]